MEHIYVGLAEMLKLPLGKNKLFQTKLNLFFICSISFL